MLLGVVAIFVTSVSSCKGGKKDEDILASVNQKIQTVPEMSNLSASVKDGVVTLNGECKDEASKTLAENTVKGIDGVKSVVDNATIAMPATTQPAPVEINADDALMTGVKDATKDFPQVKAEVKDGVITLTGSIKRASLPTLMQALNTLKPKKIENKLTIK